MAGLASASGLLLRCVLAAPASVSRISAGRCHRRRRAAIPSQQRRLRRQAAARDSGRGLRLSRLRRRRLAGHSADQRHGLAGTQTRTQHAEALSQQSQRHIFRRDAQRRARRRNVWHGSGGRRLRQRRLSRHPGHLRRAEPFCSRTPARAPSSTSPKPADWAGGRLSARPRCGSISIATACWICLSAIM